MRLRIMVVVGLVLASSLAGLFFSTSPKGEWGIPVAQAGVRERATGSIWGWVFNDWDGPHYGVSFRGTNGADPNYTGPGGNAATAPYSGGIKAWNWWGTGLGTLLTPRSWLCYPLWNCDYANRSNPLKYNALITR